MKGGDMKLEDIRRILVLGAGTMGRQIAFQCAIYGYHVNLYDIDPNQLESAVNQIKKFGSKFEKDGHLAKNELDSALGRIFPTTDPEEAAKDVDLVSESVPENPKLKGEIFSQFNKLCPANTIFTTNTSSLTPSMIAEATGRPDKFAALHFHQPIWISNVVDIVGHPGTSEETISLICAFAKKIGQIPIVLNKESPFYVFNAMLNALCDSAINLAREGVASIEDIDRAWIGITKMPIGPFGILDAIGLDLVCEVSEYWAKALDNPDIQANAEFCKKYVDKGQLGVKTGQGFYTYPDPAFRKSDFISGE